MTIQDAIREAVGTDMWVVAARLTTRLKAKGYTVAVPVARYKAIVEEYYRATGRCWCCGAIQEGATERPIRDAGSTYGDRREIPKARNW